MGAAATVTCHCWSLTPGPALSRGLMEVRGSSLQPLSGNAKWLEETMGPGDALER